MKRKLSALLAIVLAVVMVFPTAVFVGADDPATTPENPKIEKFEVKIVDMNGKSVPVDSGIDVPVDGWVDVTVDTDATEINFYLSDNAIATSSEITNGYKFTGRYADNSGTLKITVTKKGEEGTTPDTKEITINITCHKPVVVDLATGNATDKDTGKKVAVTYSGGNGDDSIDPGVVVKDATVEIKLDNGKTFKDKNAKINTEESFGSAANDNLSVKVKGGEDKLWFAYKIDTDYGIYSGVASKKIYVLGKAISEITIESAPNETFLPSDTGVSKSELVVKAKYSDGSNDVLNDYTLHGIYNVTKGDNAVEAAIQKAKDPNASNAASFEDYLSGEEIYIVVSYDGKYAAVAAEEILDFSNPIPTNIEIIPQSNAENEYVSGQTLGDFGWNGILIKVSYADGVEAKYYYNDNGGTITYDGSSRKCPGITSMKGTLEIKPFVYGDDDVKIIYEENGTRLTRYMDVAPFFTVEKKVVEKLEIANTKNVKVAYQDGDKLNLDNLTLNVYYNSGEVEEISYANPNVTCSPAHNSVLAANDEGKNQNILIVYTYIDEETDKEYSVKTSLPITVTAAKADSTIKEVILIPDGNKTEYFIGESFEKDGYKLFVTYNDNTKSKYVELSDCLNFSITDTAKYKSGEFIKAFSGSLNIKFKLPTSVDSKGEYYTLILENITVTKRPVLQSIVADCIKDTYMVGDMPEVQQFTITAKYDDNSTRVFQFADDVTDTEKAKSTFTDTVGGVTYTIKVTPTRIEEDTDAIRVSYSEKVSGVSGTVTKYDDVEIEVVVPDAILSYYDGGWRTKAYMDFDEALDAAEEYADQLTSSYQQSRKPSIQLCKDITVLYDYSVKEYMEIDLNGFDLIMVPGEIFVKSTSTAELTFVNTGDEDSQIIYSKTNEDDNIIIAENDTYTIDADSGDGKYEVTITKPTNGKVTGPDEVTHGHDAKFTITPNEDYEVKTITVKEGKTTKKYDNKDNVVTVKDVQGALTITVTFQEKAWENPFSDVYKSATYYKSIQFVYENGLFSGMSATKFEPDTTMTRAMFVTVLGRLAGIDADEAASRYGTTSSFSDVSATDASISYAVPYIKWATDNGLIEGYGNGKFGPKDNITHIQMYVLMQRYAAFIERLNTSATGTNIPANDVKDIPTWAGAYEAVEYAAKKQFLVTSSNRLTPNGNAKRSELAMLLEKFCTNVLEWDN